jgi:TetR/AcrR family transcriptional repressor of mexJK operon
MRLTIQSAGEMPDLAREVFETGPRRSRAEVAAFLEMEAKAGRLAIDDALQAAEFFAGMVLGHNQTRALLGIGAPLSEDKIDAVAKAAAAMFMRAYAP